MPRPDLAKLFGENLTNLPGPDGTHVRLLEHSTFGQAPDVAARIKARQQDIGERLVHLAEANGYRISHPSDPKPIEAAGTKVVDVHCAACGTRVLQFPVDDQLKASVPKLSLEHIKQMDHACA